ncbi:MAG: MFS transporter, partial [Candidatus Heimdallarchaeota archaeon]|nr:MFS transporter [Candidatus Heimdallarchaeota archaeon]MCK4954148.1 MFS transporter [Candidatus Heimdallarchaeota archaeon]
MENIQSSGTETDKSSKKRFFFERNEVLILIGIFFFGFSSGMFNPYVPIWLENIFAVDSYFLLGFAAVIPNFLFAVGTTVWGILADKFGKRKFVLIGFISQSIMFFFLLFVNTSTLFLVVMVVGYLFISAQFSNVYAFATLTSSKKKEVILGEITASFSLAWAISSPLAGKIHEAAKDTTSIVSRFASSIPDVFSDELHNNPDMALQLFIAVIVCVIAFSFLFFTKETQIQKVIADTKTSELKKVKITLFPAIFIIIIITAFFQQATAGGFWAYASVYFINVLETSAIHFSYFLIVTTLFGFFLSLLLGRVTKTNRVILCVIAGMFIQVMMYLLMTLYSTNIILGLIVYSFPSYVISNISIYGLISTFSNEKRRATAYG